MEMQLCDTLKIFKNNIKKIIIVSVKQDNEQKGVHDLLCNLLDILHAQGFCYFPIIYLLLKGS